jgi:hypothetical protein
MTLEILIRRVGETDWRWGQFDPASARRVERILATEPYGDISRAVRVATTWRKRCPDGIGHFPGRVLWMGQNNIQTVTALEGITPDFDKIAEERRKTEAQQENK